MNQNITLTSNNKSVTKVVHAVQNDTGRVLNVTLDREDLTSSMTYNAVIEKPSGLSCYIPATFDSVSKVISVELTNQALAEEGNAKAQIEVTDTAGRVTSYFFYLAVEKALRDDETIESSNEFTALQAMGNSIAQAKAEFDNAIRAVSSDTEVTDIRVKEDGTTASTAGNAVREQVGAVYNEIGGAIDNMIGKKAFYHLPYTKGMFIDRQTGAERADAGWEASDYVEIGNLRHNKLVTSSTMQASYNIYNAFYNASKQYISSFTLGEEITIPTGAVYFRTSKEITATTTINPYIPQLVDEQRFALATNQINNINLKVADLEEFAETTEADVMTLKEDLTQLDNDFKLFSNEKTYNFENSGTSYFPFKFRAGKKYVFRNISDGNSACNLKTIDNVNSKTVVETVASGLSASLFTEFIPTQNADGFSIYINSAGVLTVEEQDLKIEKMQSEILKNTLSRISESIGVDRHIFADADWVYGSVSGGNRTMFHINIMTFSAIHTNDFLFVTIADGWRIKIDFIKNGAYERTSGYITGTYTIPKDSDFKITIGRVTTTSNRPLNIADAVSKVSYVKGIDLIQKIQKMQGNGLCFALQSDTHYSVKDENHRKGIKQFADLSNYIGFDFIGNLGDLIRGYETDTYADSCADAIFSVHDYMVNKKAETQMLFTIGNHDDASLYVYRQNRDGASLGLSSLIDDKEQYAKYIATMGKNISAMNGNRYYYYDVRDYRIIVLDSHDRPLTETDGKLDGYGNWNNQYYGFHEAQMEWFANVALKTDKKVLVFSHVPLAKLDDYDNETTKTGYAMRGILDAFVKGEAWSGTVTNGNEWDFNVHTSYVSQGAGTVIGCFSGHTHTDASKIKNVSSGTLYNHINIKNGCDNGKIYVVNDGVITEIDYKDISSVRTFTI